MDNSTTELLQTILSISSLVVALLAGYRAGGRHSHGEPPALPISSEVPVVQDRMLEDIEIVPAVSEEVVEAFAVTTRGPIALPRNPPKRAPFVCECGIPGRVCRIHGGQ